VFEVLENSGQLGRNDCDLFPYFQNEYSLKVNVVEFFGTFARWCHCLLLALYSMYIRLHQITQNSQRHRL